MKLLLTTLNSKFVHSCLSIRYLAGYSKDLIDTEIKEFTINQNIDYIVSEIYKINPDIIGFSTYIWNFNEIMEISEILKLIMPDITIILGGPEVSYDADLLMKEKEFIDFVIYGEGEETFHEFIKEYLGNKNYKEVRGLVYREKNIILKNPPRPLIQDLDTIPSPYDEKVGEELKNRIVYYESSRGCPFGCKFCLSSTIKGVRYFPIERVKKELDLLIDANVRQVKFVDRTFNARKEYAMEIINFIMDKNPKNINFHFEVTAHLLDREMLNFLSKVPEGLIQFEIGVQSTNPKTIEAVGRKTDFPKLVRVTKEIKSFNKIHQHLDLIAGLPYEGYKSFRKSFNDVFDIRPEKIQLGFLKVLKGSQLRAEEKKYGFKYLNKPPYEILETNYLSYKEVRKLKVIEDMVEKFYNEENFKHSLEYIIRNHYETAFDFFEDIATFWEVKGYQKVSHSKRKLYNILIEFYEEKNFKDLIVFNELLKLDYIINNQGSPIANKIERYDTGLTRSQIHEILKTEELLENELSKVKNIETRFLIRDIHIEKFQVNVLKIIKDGYLMKNQYNEEVYILTLYKKGVINLAENYNINYVVKEMI